MCKYCFDDKLFFDTLRQIPGVNADHRNARNTAVSCHQRWLDHRYLSSSGGGDTCSLTAYSANSMGPARMVSGRRLVQSRLKGISMPLNLSQTLNLYALASILAAQPSRIFSVLTLAVQHCWLKTKMNSRQKYRKMLTTHYGVGLSTIRRQLLIHSSRLTWLKIGARLDLFSAT